MASTYSGNRLKDSIHSCGIMQFANASAPPMVSNVCKQLLINGKLVDSSDNSTVCVVNPLTGDVLVDGVSRGTIHDADCAVQYAHSAYAQGTWDKSSLECKCEGIEELVLSIIDNSDRLETLQSLESGMMLMNSRADVKTAVATLRNIVYGWTSLSSCNSVASTTNKLNLQSREAVGVVVALVSAHCSLSMLINIICTCIMSGNCVVVKVSDLAPLHFLELASIICSCKNIPAGVINIITGTQLVGSKLAQNSFVKKVVVVGSTMASNAIVEECSTCRPAKQVEISNTGSSCGLVCPQHQDMDNIVEIILNSSFRHCYCADDEIRVKTLFVPAESFHDFTTIMTRRLDSITHPKVGMGSLCCNAEYHHTMTCIEMCVDSGARLIYGGGVSAGSSGGAKQRCVEPTVFVDEVQSKITCLNVDMCGPVLFVHSYDSLCDVMKHVNSLCEGRNAVLFGNNTFEVLTISKTMRASNIAVNALKMNRLSSVSRMLEFVTVLKDVVLVNHESNQPGICYKSTL